MGEGGVLCTQHTWKGLGKANTNTGSNVRAKTNQWTVKSKCRKAEQRLGPRIRQEWGGDSAPTPFGFTSDCPSLAGSGDWNSHLDEPLSHKGPTMCLHFSHCGGRASDWGRVLVAPSGPCWLCTGGLGEAIKETLANRSAHWELSLSLTHGWRVGFHNTAPPPWLKLSFCREAGQGQVTPSSPQRPIDTRPHLMFFRHQALRSSCSRTNQALPPPPSALWQACFPPLHTRSLLQRWGGTLPGRPSPLGLVSNPTARLYLHTRVCQRCGCPGQLLWVSLQSWKQLFWTLHQPAQDTFTHTHTHTLSQVVLAKALSCIMFFVQIRKPRLRKAC